MPQARHPKAAVFTRRKLFADVTTFAELESRIAALPDERSRGDAFEVFAEAYLATQRKHDAATIWPLAAVPTQILRTLGLSTNDYGVDGVFQTLLGQFNAYQVKFRTGRPALTWRELSTFMGLADSNHIHSRVLFTNCDDLPAMMNDRQGFFCVRGSDLDRLEADDFRAIEAWLADAAFIAPKKAPQPHQTQALNALFPALETHDRVSAIMACGTGKTLVALWIAEHVARASSPASSGGVLAARILVLLPSLALLRQTLHEWLHETSLPALAYLCVCSDATVKEGIDAIDTPQSDLDFEVTTDSRSVREFLDAPFSGVKVVFSTYQSARVVGEALRKGETFDLAIFDEAHKTAGREGRNYSFALEDANMPIRKRLFLTATPRHYNPLRKDKEGDAQLVFSMDRPEVYGPQVFRLTFAEAARRGIICGYKVVISVITSEMVTNELLSHGEVLVNGDAVRARQVANQIALRDAIEKYGVKKVFTFHSTVESAASFVSDGSEGIGTHLAFVAADVSRLTLKEAMQPPHPIPLPQGGEGARRAGEGEQNLVTSAAASGFQTFHVNGTMPTARREREMRDFRAAACAVMSNARCLTEGVDVPAVDMVAFLSPRRSRVDIVQATGRAMRRSPGKTTGYVLVPLYLEQTAGETIEQAVARAEFEDVWDVLQSLQEQDEVLAEIIREMREERGRTKGFDDSRFREYVEILGPEISLEKLRQAISTTCIEALVDDWEERFGELNMFKERFGHCNVPQGWKENSQLGSWAAKQRGKKKSGKLSGDRRLRLEQIGFTWDPLDSQWEEMFQQLIDYKRTYNDCRVPVGWRDNPQLGKWVVKQRQAKKNKRLGEIRIRRLDKLGFVWDPFDKYWEEMYSMLEQYRKRHGDCNVPQGWQENPSLGSWVATQRTLKRESELTEERIRRLAKLKFVWNPIDSQWEAMFVALKIFKGNYGHCNVPNNWLEHPQLRVWLNVQRRRKKKGSLTEEYIKRLDELGIVWNPRRSSWEDMFEELLTYRRKHGNCNVPDNCVENPPLGTWVSKQRSAKKRGTLSVELVRRLDQVGLVWEPIGAFWDQMFAELAEFKNKQGHCNVPSSWEENCQLATWVGTQRQLCKTGKLSEGRIRQLENIGFNWDPRDARWEKMFAALVQYRKQNGDCTVPQGWRQNPKLGKWVDHQRHFKKIGTLSEARIRRLVGIGFQWVAK